MSQKNEPALRGATEEAGENQMIGNVLKCNPNPTSEQAGDPSAKDLSEQSHSIGSAEKALITELDTSRIVRPHLFYSPEVAGMLIPETVLQDSVPTGQWGLYLKWSDGRRERQELAKKLDLPSGPLWLLPEPPQPEPARMPGWSMGSRQAWLAGKATVDPPELFTQLCQQIRKFVHLPPETAMGDTATLALWIILTYVYPCWNAVPYLSVWGPIGSGKSRIFEVLAKLVYQPTVSVSMSESAMFRSLHESGGTLLLDEAERLGGYSPGTADLKTLLLGGYKRGSGVIRCEPQADKSFRPAKFDVFGPKALAAINSLPDALLSRCIRIHMFRTPKDCPQGKLRIDADNDAWARLRDALHVLAIENAAIWLSIVDSDHCPPAIFGRNHEIWSSLCSIAGWLDGLGGEGLLDLIQEHAVKSIECSRVDQIPEEDEILLRLLTEAIQAGENGQLRPSDLLEQAKSTNKFLFDRWSAKRVGSTLGKYKLATNKNGVGDRVYGKVTIKSMLEVQEAYGIDLDLAKAA